MKQLYTLFFLCFIFTLATAQKEDYNWIWGGRYAVSDTVESVVISFNDTRRILGKHQIELRQMMDQNNASISDKEGNLLFYTNGCVVTNANHELMEGGDSLNYGEWYDFDDCTIGYSGPQNTSIVPDPGNDMGYYIVHKPIEYISGYESSIGHPKIMYSYVDMSLNNGLGKVVVKNHVFFERDNTLGSFNHMVQHANGKDWWNIHMRDTTNTYYKILIDDSGPHLVDSVNIGPIFHYDMSQSGQGKFSPDGSKWAMGSIYMGLMVFDFDRSNGNLSNLEVIPIPWKEYALCGLEWSANGRFIYFSLYDRLYQVDTDDGNEIRVIGEWDGTNNPFGTAFGHMMRAPDCRIYMSSYSSTKTIHVINNPDELGESCDFRQHGLDLLKVSTGTISIPNFPNFRIDTGPVCDPEITTAVDAPIFKAVMEMTVFPNPASEIFYLNLPDIDQKGTLSLYGMNGSLVLNQWMHAKEEVNVSHLTPGIYIVRFVSERGHAYRARLIVA